MDKSRVKNFAVSARVKLKEQIKQKAYTFGITKDEIKKVEMFEDAFQVNGNKYNKRLLKHRESLVKKINERSFDQVIEEVAYTWFNRLIAIRFMEVNEYLPSGVRVLSSIDNSKVEPDIIGEATNLDFENLNIDLIYKFHDENNTEELFKYLLIKQCNELGKIMPGVFEEIEDFTELLLPDNLLHEGSIIRDLVTLIAEEDFKEQVEIIGWLYQYYISEKKDEVFADLKNNVKITKENIPAATQLFTPDWIVKYMVENSLGRLWIESHPNDELKAKWKYYLEEAEQEPEVQKQLEDIREKNKDLKPEDIKVIDPCMGSGHILVYLFDVLYDIYKSSGYSEREIPKLILTNNIFGLDIDDRAAQLSFFAVMMKARSYNRRIFREKIDLNICSIQESNDINGQLTVDSGQFKGLVEYFCGGQGTVSEHLKDNFEYLINVFNDAKEYGSILEVKEIDFDAIERRLEEIRNSDTTDLFEVQYRNIILEIMPGLIKQGRIMSGKYDVVCTNPPYMGRRNMSNKLKNFLDVNYDEAKNDLSTVFISKGLKYVEENKYLAMITMHSWMFLQYFEKIRRKIVDEKTIQSMVHLGARAFDEISGEVVQTTTFIIKNGKLNRYLGKYSDVKSYMSSEEKKNKYLNGKNIYLCSGKLIKFIHGNPIAYWITPEFRNIFKLESIDKKIHTVGQNLTGNNEKFLRWFWEMDSSFIGIGRKWLLYTKGGGSRKWYGNFSYAINWSNEARNHYKNDKICRVIPEQYWYKRGISFNLMATSEPTFRELRPDVTHDITGSAFYVNDNEYSILMGLLNSKISSKVLQTLNPTLSYQLGDVSKIPFNEKINDMYSDIKRMVNQCMYISRVDWNLVETSWDFKIHPLLKLLDREGQYKLESNFRIWETKCKEAFQQLKYNEEELNRIFIEIYELQDELTPEVEDKDITIRKADRVRDIKSFISYAVGCMFGRYSLDEEGLIYAGGEWEDKWRMENGQWTIKKSVKDRDGSIIDYTWDKVTFTPDPDNVIPITDDEYFEDDIVSRFVEFVKITFSEETLEENLDYIADTLGKKSNETSRQTIRRYFLKDFYKDHLKTYQKKPIYWLFDSGKNDGFKALIYMHRYDIGTVSKVRIDYLHLLQRKYEAEVNRLDMVLENDNESVREKAEGKKKKEKIQKQIIECIQYDLVIAHVANQKVRIDLDDGVSVNYGKFQGVEIPQGEGKKPLKADLLGKI